MSYHSRPSWWTCPGCGKRGYLTRADARRAAKHHPNPTGLAAYRCEYRPDVWHVGHLPPEVRRGHVARDGVRHVLDDRERDRVFGATPTRRTQVWPPSLSPQTHRK